MAYRRHGWNGRTIKLQVVEIGLNDWCYVALYDCEGRIAAPRTRHTYARLLKGVNYVILLFRIHLIDSTKGPGRHK